MQISCVILTLLGAFLPSVGGAATAAAGAAKTSPDADPDLWNNCEMPEPDFQQAPWVVTIRRVSPSGQVKDFPGAVLDHRTVVTQFVRYVVHPGSDWQLCKGATYTVFTDSPRNGTRGLGVIRVTPHPWIHLEGADESDHWLWYTQRYNLVLVHLRQPLVLSRTLRPVCIPTLAQARELKSLVQAAGSGLISGWNRQLPDQRLTLGLNFLPEEQCVDLFKNITKEEPFGDRACGHNFPTGTLLNPGMTCISMDGGTVLRLGNQTLLLGFTNDFYSNREKGRCDEVATQYISILNENSSDWIRKGQTCGTGSFACSDGTCIEIRYLCDGVADCPDDRDEDERYCKPRNCCLRESEFACGVHGECIPRQPGIGNCNGVVDCPGGEDEHSAVCPKSPITKAVVQKAVIGVGTATVVILSVAALFVVYLRRRGRRKYVARMISDFLTDDGAAAQDGGEDRVDIGRVRYDPTLEYDLENCSVETYLGGGRFGSVHRAIMYEKSVVIKTNLSPTDAGMADLGSFLSLLLELKMMVLLKRLGGHDNIVSLKGANTKQIRAFRLQIAMEYCSNGSVEAFLRTNRAYFRKTCKRDFYQLTRFVDSKLEKKVPVLTTVDLIKWAMQIAQAMQFLALNRIVHGDLACRNVVLDGGLNAKLCDFGLSHQISDSAVIYTTTTRLDIPWPWAAPEVLQSLGRVCHRKSDVWSFGVTTWEILSLGQVPWGELRSEKELQMLLKGGAVLPRPEFCPTDEFYKALLSCWEMNAESRPSFDELALQLQTSYDAMCSTFEVLGDPDGPSALRPETDSQEGPKADHDVEPINPTTETFAGHYIALEKLMTVAPC